MEHLKIAIADDNQKILDLLDRVIGMEKDMNLVGKAKNGEEMCQIIKDKQPDYAENGWIDGYGPDQS